MCQHKHTSLVQVVKDTSWIAGEKQQMVLTHQCDNCDMHVWDKPIPDDVFDAWMWGTLEVPELDLSTMKEAIVKFVREVVDGILVP